MWVSNREPNRGDLIRVKRPYYYHVGLFYGDNKVIHFAGQNDDAIANPDSVLVHIAPLENFLRGGDLEVYVFDFNEIRNTYPVEERIKRAESELGNKGYNLLHNNCENFAFRCVYKIPPKTQYESLRENIINKINK